jgi:uncharacterized protein (TIGR02145 family)
VNINLLTHLERARLKELVKNGKTFAQAKAEAQSEILALFGWNNPDMPGSEELDISVNEEKNGILLALSILMQGRRNTASLTSLLADFSAILKNGTEGDSVFIADFRYEELPQFPSIRQNLINRYQSIGITADIPDFEKYLMQFFNNSGAGPGIEVFPCTGIDSSQAVLHFSIQPNSQNTTVSVDIGYNEGIYSYSLTPEPDEVSGSDTVKFSFPLINLYAEQEYHYRIKAINQAGATYSDDYSFETWPRPAIYPNSASYAAVKIGTQVWLRENLHTSIYNDNTSIPLVTDSISWKLLSTPGYCWYNNNESQVKEPYGALYNWYTVNTGKLCPSGWHVPSDADWNTLIEYLGGEAVAGNKLKEEGNAHWSSPNSASNESIFTALPGGIRSSGGEFMFLNFSGNYWSSASIDQTNSTYISLRNNKDSIINGLSYPKKTGLSVRCVRD